MTDSRKTMIIAIAVLAGILAIYSGWRTFGSSGGASADRTSTASGRVNPMSSMLGPDASGKPRTQYDGQGINSQGPPGGAMMNRMMGRPGGPMPGGPPTGR